MKGGVHTVVCEKQSFTFTEGSSVLSLSFNSALVFAPGFVNTDLVSVAFYNI